jgi:tetratricopeptide (TPR) repeat protein
MDDPGDARQRDRWKQALALGREHYDRHEYERAEHFLRTVLGANAGYADVHNMMGVIVHERGDFAGAAEFFERAVALNPSYTEALLNLAISFNDLGRYAEARDVFMRVRQARSTGEQPGDAYALGKIANLHAGVAQAYADIGRLPDAAGELEKAVALRPEFVDLRVKLATLYKDQGRLADAARELEKATTQNPSYVKARVVLGVTLLAMGKRADAAVRFREALELDPAHTAAKMYLRFAEKPTALSVDMLDGEWETEPKG